MDTNFFTLWPIAPFGGEDPVDPPAANGDASQGNSGDGKGQPANQAGQGSQDSGKGKGDKDSDDEDDDEDEYEGYSAKELKRIAKDNAKKAADAEKERKRLEDEETARQRKKNDDVTNLTNDVTELKKENESLRATMTRQAIIGAIRDDNRFEWYDPTMVAQQLDPEVVKVSDDGKVEGMKSQLTKVAKDHPFLLKKDNTGNGQQGGQPNNDGGASGPTGFQPGQGGASNGGGDIDRKKLAEDYPALATRV